MHDLRDAFRALRATPIVTATAVLSLALGIGANTSMFSILNGLLLRALPVSRPDQLALIQEGDGDTSFTNPIWEAIRDHRDLFAAAAASSTARFNIAGGGQTQFVDGLWA